MRRRVGQAAAVLLLLSSLVLVVQGVVTRQWSVFLAMSLATVPVAGLVLFLFRRGRSLLLPAGTSSPGGSPTSCSPPR